MAIRSIKVKLDLENRDADEKTKVLKGVMDTHKIFHDGIFYYQNWLLTMRQGDVRFSHEDDHNSKSGAQYSADLWEAVKEARKRNSEFLKQRGEKAEFEDIKGRETEILGLIREYFDLICPAGGGGGEAKGFLNILTLIDASLPGESPQGNTNKFQKRMIKFLQNNDDIKKQLLGDHEITRDHIEVTYQKLLKSRKKYNPSITESIDNITKGYEDVQKKAELQAAGRGRILRTLKATGIFPLFPSFIRYSKNDIPPILHSERTELNIPASFEYSIWSLAVATVRGWNSWDANQKTKIESLDAKKEARLADLRNNDSEELHRFLKKYEETRNIDLKEISSNPEDKFIITPRVIRGLDEIMERWKMRGSTQDKRIEIINEFQTKKRGKFGDPHFFRWLAQDDQTSIWQNGSKIIRSYVQLQLATREKNEAKPYAVMTRADAFQHPVWFNLEGPNGSGNQPAYDIKSIDNGKWHITVPLLIVDKDAIISESISFPVRPSGQMEEVIWKTDPDGKTSIQYHDSSTGFKCDVKPKGAKLQFSRKALENWESRKNLQDESSFPLPYFNISWELILDSQSQSKFSSLLQMGPTDPITRIAPSLGWFFEKEKSKLDAFEGKGGGSVKKSILSALPESEKEIIRGYHGFFAKEQNPRFIAIDLGVRTFASCSVFRLQKERPGVGNGETTGPMFFPVKPMAALEGIEGEVYAVHERSFPIRLPGDAPPALLDSARKELEKRRNKVKYQLNAMVALRRTGLIGDKHEQKEKRSKSDLRKAAIDDFINRYSNARFDWPFSSFSATNLQDIEKHTVDPDDDWKQKIENIIKKYIDPDITTSFREWRKYSRQRGKEWFQKQRKERNAAIKSIKEGKKNIPIPPLIPFYGQSFWGIDELNESRKLMQSYHTRSLKGGKNRSTRFGKGSKFAVKLQEHIQNRKEDRLKKGAHAIVMHALGYEWAQCDKHGNPIDVENRPIEINSERIPLSLLKTGKKPDFLRCGFGNPYINRGTWIALHAPASVILFEDLSRYRTKEDRPRAENGQLMKWAHRAIPREVYMQGEIYGLMIGEVGAAYSSRFHAKTGAPGIRCNIFHRKDLENIQSQINEAMKIAREKENSEKSWRDYANQWPVISFKEIQSFTPQSIDYLLQALDEKEKKQKKKEKPKSFGILLPYRGGEYFVTLKDRQTATALNADLNAAQNLAKRFLTRYQDPEKINMHADAGQHRFFSHSGSQRVLRQSGYLAGHIATYRETGGDTDIEAKDADFNKALESKWFCVKPERVVDKKVIDQFRKADVKKKDIEREGGEEASQEEEVLELKGVFSLFRDNSNIVLTSNYLYSGKQFWTRTKNNIEVILFKKPLFQPVNVIDNRGDEH